MRIATPRNILASNSEEIKALEGHLVSLAGTYGHKSLMVTSCRRGEGATTASTLIAIVLGRSAKPSVLLIDANIGNPFLHSLFSVERQPGLTEFLSGEKECADCIWQSNYAGLSVMPHGRDCEQVIDLLSKENLQARMAQLKEKFDYIVLDAEPVLSSPNATLLARHVDVSVIVVECERTKWGQLQAAKERILAADGNVMGVIMNKRRYYVPRFFYNRI